MRLRPLLLLALAVLALLPLVPSRAEAIVYWASGSSLGRANLDGSMSLWPLPSGYFPALEASSACGLAVDAQHLFWGDTTFGTVGRATLAGTEPNQAFISGLGAPCGVAVTPTHVYWSDFDTNLIGRARLDGSGVEPAFVAGASRPCGVAVDGSHVYWTNQGTGTIGRADIGGGNVDHEFIVGAGGPCGLAIAGGQIFWGDQERESIGRANLDGSGVVPVLVAGAGEPWGVAANETHVFWADRWGTPANGHGGLGRARIDGSEAIPELVFGIDFITGVAVDSTVIPSGPIPLRPSDYLRFANLKHNKRDGSVKLDVFVPARGEFRVVSPAIRWKLDKGNPPPFLQGSFRWRLKLWPGRSTAAGRRVHRQIKEDGRAPIVLRMTYQQEGRTPISATKRFAFTR
jgi:virginiamycin B lyase